MTYSKLFEKGRIGRLEIKNRIVMPAMGTSFAASSGEASEEIIRYYAERARGGCGLIITEITRVDDETGIGMHNQLSATSGRHIPQLVRLAEAVHAYGAKIFVQLHHPGNQTPGRLLNGKQIVSASDVTCSVIGEQPRALSTEEVSGMVKKFVRGAVIAKTAGIDGVEIHAAHGYLINQFLSPHTNKRNDQYGGDFNKRLRFLTEIVLGVRKFCGPNFPISVRMDGNEFIPDGLTEEDCIKIAKYLEGLGVDCLNISCGTYESGATIIEPACFAEGWKKHLAKNIKAAVNIPVIAVNTIKHPAFAEQLLEEGVSDFVGVARGQLVDAEWAKKAKQGRDREIRKCIGCLTCFLVANQGRPIECTLNPILGREYHYGRDAMKKDGHGRTVAVIGAGPAGVEASLVLAARGFHAVLFEKSDHIGGILKIGSVPPHKELLGEYIDTMQAQLEAAGVDLRLNTPGTVEACKSVGAEAVFVAGGGNPIIPKLPGVEKAVTAESVLAGRYDFKGKKIAIIGGGVTGLETAEWLSPNNEVSVIEMLDKVGTSLYPSVLLLLKQRLAKNNVEILTQHALTEVKEGAVLLKQTTDGSVVERPAEVVILALGVRPDRSLQSDLEASFEHVVYVGDAEKGGTILNALHAAYDRAFALDLD